VCECAKRTRYLEPNTDRSHAATQNVTRQYTSHTHNSKSKESKRARERKSGRSRQHWHWAQRWAAPDREDGHGTWPPSVLRCRRAHNTGQTAHVLALPPGLTAARKARHNVPASPSLAQETASPPPLEVVIKASAVHATPTACWSGWPAQKNSNGCSHGIVVTTGAHQAQRVNSLSQAAIVALPSHMRPSAPLEVSPTSAPPALLPPLYLAMSRPLRRR
jgi:hypothetical protein